jgi:hypothetical protein
MQNKGRKNEDDDGDLLDDLQEECWLMQFSSTKAKIRVVCELCMEAGSILYVMYFLSLNMFIENLVRDQS